MLFASNSETWALLIDQWAHEASHYKNYWVIWKWNFLSNLEYLTIADVTVILIFMFVVILLSVWIIVNTKVKDDYLEGYHDGVYSSLVKTAKMRCDFSDIVLIVVSDTEYRKTIDQIVYLRHGKSREVLHNTVPEEGECHSGTCYTEYTPWWYRALRYVWHHVFKDVLASARQGYESVFSMTIKKVPTDVSESNKKEPTESLSDGPKKTE
jgi:hypothetical protein